MLLHALGDDGDLLVGQHAAFGFGEGRHCSAGDAVGGDALGVRAAGDGEVDGIGERDGRTVPAVFTVAGGAVLAVEGGEVEDLFRARNLGRRAGLAGGVAAGGDERDGPSADAARAVDEALERSVGPYRLWRPARRRNGSAWNWGVRTLACRLTT